MDDNVYEWELGLRNASLEEQGFQVLLSFGEPSLQAHLVKLTAQPVQIVTLVEFPVVERLPRMQQKGWSL